MHDIFFILKTCPLRIIVQTDVDAHAGVDDQA
jgi:hypothetical protein